MLKTWNKAAYNSYLWLPYFVFPWDMYKYIQNSICLNEKIDTQTNLGVEGSLLELVKGFIPQWSFDLKQCVGMDQVNHWNMWDSLELWMVT